MQNSATILRAGQEGDIELTMYLISNTPAAWPSIYTKKQFWMIDYNNLGAPPPTIFRPLQVIQDCQLHLTNIQNRILATEQAPLLEQCFSDIKFHPETNTVSFRASYIFTMCVIVPSLIIPAFRTKKILLRRLEFSPNIISVY